MSKTIYEVSVITGKYVNKDGVNKNRYLKIGSVIETKNGPSLKLECIPIMDTGGWNGWAFLNTPKDQSADGLPQLEDDDVPF
jgi:hypothetical protein